MTQNYTPKIEEVGGGRRQITKPKTEILPLTPQALEYLTTKRGFRKETIEAYRLGCDKKGDIVLPFHDENNELSLVKFRHPQGEILRWKAQIEDGSWEDREGKSRIEKGGKGVLFGSHLCDPAEGPLVLCYGDYDAMAVAQDGVPNCVGMPFGDGGFEFLKHQWNFLESFSEIVIYNDADKFTNPEAELRAKKKLDELATRLGKHRTRLVKTSDRHGTKDANELLLTGREDANRIAVYNADWFPTGIVAVADYEETPLQPGTPIGLSAVDQMINGLVPRCLIIVGGDNEAGKTTNVLNFVANFVEERVPVFLWSGEQGVKDIRYSFERIAAGPGFLQKQTFIKTGFDYFYPLDDIKEPIRNWYRDYFFQYTEVGIDSAKFFQAAEIAVRRYGCGLIVADNLMAFTGGEGEGYYQAQGDFAQEMKAFAERWNVPAILIAHNKKEKDWLGKTLILPNKDSVEGSKKITSWADVVMQIYRVPEAPKYREAAENADSIVIIDKNRASKRKGKVRLLFDEESNRLFQMTEEDTRFRQFSWIKGTAYEAHVHRYSSSTMNF